MAIHAESLVQAIADRTRLRALVLLERERSLCVRELTVALGVSQPRMSRHLSALRALGVVEDRRLANRVFYRLHPELPGWAHGALLSLAVDVTATAAYRVVETRLREMPDRPEERPSVRDDRRLIGPPPVCAS